MNTASPQPVPQPPLPHTTVDMESPPQTKKQGHKGAKEKRQGADRLGSAKHVRLAQIAAEKRKGKK